VRRSYGEKLRDPLWQRRRLEVMDRDEFACTECGDKASTLNVHHKYYLRGRDPWDYPDSALVTLCDTCHLVVQGRMDRLHSELAKLSELDVDVLIGYCIGVSMARLCRDVDGDHPHRARLLSYEEGIGVELALASERPWVGQYPLCEYLAKRSWELDSEDPILKPLFDSAWAK